MENIRIEYQRDRVLNSTTNYLPVKLGGFGQHLEEFSFCHDYASSRPANYPRRPLPRRPRGWANAWQQFIEITIPQLMPITMVTTVLLIIGNMNSFTIPFVMTGGGPAHQSEIIITWIYNLSFQGLRFGYASAISVVLFITLFIFSFFYVRILTQNER